MAAFLHRPLLGVEIEGSGAARNRPGRPPHAMRTAEQRLAVVRESGISFAIVFPLTSASLAELEWAVEFAAAQAAALLQVRPSAELRDEQMATAWMMVDWLSELQRGKLAIHVDAVPLQLAGGGSPNVVKAESGAGGALSGRDCFASGD